MRILRFFTFCCLLTIVIAPIILLILAVEDEPRVVRKVLLTPEYIARAKEIIDVHREREQTNPATIATAKILSADLDIAANYLANRFGNGGAKVLTSNGSALVILSFPLPEQFLDGYLNLQVTFAQTTGLPRPQSIQIGNLPLPNLFTNFLTSKLTDWLQNSPELRASIDSIQHIKISRNEVNVIYRWNNDFSKKSNGIAVLGKEEQARLFHYNLFLVRNSAEKGATVVSLSEILQLLMHHAAIQSINGNAPAENRAVILVATFHVLGFPLKLIAPEAIDWPTPIKQTVKLDGRNDFAKHFMVSAAITAYADTKLSDAIGLYKEIEDLRGGSGFSFNDIAANRAGTEFGKKAIANHASAVRIQQLIVSGLKDTDLMPPWLDLPEHMTESEFQQRFGGINEPIYQQMTAEIESRVSTLRILRAD